MDTTISRRMFQLLQMVADAYDEERDPFSPDNLDEHGVTVTERIELAEFVAWAIRNFLLEKARIT